MVMSEFTSPTRLKEEYRARVRGTSQEETNLHWCWYLREKYKVDGSKDIFFELQRPTFTRGLQGILNYLRDIGLSRQQFYNAIKVDAAGLYGQQLFDNGLITSAPGRDFISITEDTALEYVKVFSPRVGMDLSGSMCPVEMSHPASVIWYRFLERSHELYQLPPVSEMAPCLRVDNPQQQAVLKSNDFTLYTLTEQERADVLTLVGR